MKKTTKAAEGTATGRMAPLRSLLTEAMGAVAAGRPGLACPPRPVRAEGGAALLRERSAQGTTEYAILVGVLVVIAILAIITFRDRVSELWDAISSGINSL